VANELRPNIVLTGFMGTGKTAVGRRIAALTDREFVDIDAEIVAKHGDIPSIFDKEGEDHFRQLERNTVTAIAPRRNLVIATGGGTMLDPDNVVAFLGAEIFTLTAEPSEILRRVSDEGLETRPLLADADDPEAAITRMLAKRAESYGRFIEVDTTARSVDEVIDALRTAGATIERREEVVAASGGTDSTNRIFTVIIAAALAVLIVLVFIVLSF
jgi:shikimate kinase